MNSFRIGVIRILVENWDIGMADCFLHYFEGWIIFVACLAVLFAEISLQFLPGWRAVLPLLGAIVVLLATWAINLSLTNREEVTPVRSTFTQFPLLRQDWVGREQAIEQKVLSSLALTDHIMADYSNPAFSLPVNLYIAYYESQRTGASVHSPKFCIPGGGWEIQSIDQVNVDDALAQSTAGVERDLRSNRVIIQIGGNRQLVYFWFQQRGRRITNEYLVKRYLFVDSLRLQRTDGALVRIVIPVPDGVPMEQAEQQLQTFLRDFYPLLNRYLPE